MFDVCFEMANILKFEAHAKLSLINSTPMKRIGFYFGTANKRAKVQVKQTYETKMISDERKLGMGS